MVKTLGTTWDNMSLKQLKHMEQLKIKAIINESASLFGNTMALGMIRRLIEGQEKEHKCRGKSP